MNNIMLKLLTATPENAIKTAQIIYKSGTYIKYSSWEAILTTMMQAESMGISPFQLLGNAFPTKSGKLGFSTALMLGLCARSPQCMQIIYDIANDAKKAVVRIFRKWLSGKEIEYVGEFTIEDARRAGLLSKDTYKKYPAQMLAARAGAIAARKAFPDLLAGCYTSEELEGVAPEPQEPVKVELWRQEAIAKLEAINPLSLPGGGKGLGATIEKAKIMAKEPLMLVVAKCEAAVGLDAEIHKEIIASIARAKTPGDMKKIMKNMLAGDQKDLTLEEQITEVTRYLLKIYPGNKNILDEINRISNECEEDRPKCLVELNGLKYHIVERKKNETDTKTEKDTAMDARESG